MPVKCRQQRIAKVLANSQKDVPSEQDTENDHDDAKRGEIANAEAADEKTEEEKT